MRFVFFFAFAACAIITPHPELDARVLNWKVRDAHTPVEPYVSIYKTTFDGSSNPAKKLLKKLVIGSSGVNLTGPNASTSAPIFDPGITIQHAGGVTTTIRADVDSNFLYFNGAVRVQGNVYSDGKFYGQAGSGSNQFEVTVAGARVDFGPGASDYASSDGTTVTFAGPVVVTGSFVTSGTIRTGSSYLNANAQVMAGGGLAFSGDSYLQGNVADSAANSATTLTNASAMTAGLDRYVTVFTRGAGGANIVAKVATDGSFIGGFAPVTRAVSATAPTISSGFGTSPSVATNNGTAAFTINVGTGGVATSGVIGLPTATNGWVCQCDDIAAAVSTSETKMSATSTTSCTVTNVNTATGVAVAWAASEILHCTAMGR